MDKDKDKKDAQSTKSGHPPTTTASTSKPSTSQPSLAKKSIHATVPPHIVPPAPKPPPPPPPPPPQAAVQKPTPQKPGTTTTTSTPPPPLQKSASAPISATQKPAAAALDLSNLTPSQQSFHRAHQPHFAHHHLNAPTPLTYSHLAHEGEEEYERRESAGSVSSLHSSESEGDRLEAIDSSVTIQGYDSNAAIVGPSMKHSIDEDLAPIFEARFAHIELSLVFIMILLSAMMAVIQYAYLIIPEYLASRQYLSTTYFMPDAKYGMFQCWIPLLVGVLMVIEMYVLVQYPKNVNWRRVREWRWLPGIILQVYLISACLHFSVQTEPVHRKIEHIMKDRFNAGGRNLDSLELTQIYHNCCGLKGPKDWEKYSKDAKLIALWHGSLCQGNETLFGSKKKTLDACSVPNSCWYQLKTDGPGRRHFRYIHKRGCVDQEAHFAHAVIGFYVAFLCLVLCAMVATYGYLFCVIRIAEKRHIELGPKMKFESCLQ